MKNDIKSRNRRYKATTGAVDENQNQSPTTWTRLDEKTGNNTRIGSNRHKHQPREHARNHDRAKHSNTQT